MTGAGSRLEADQGARHAAPAEQRVEVGIPAGLGGLEGGDGGLVGGCGCVEDHADRHRHRRLQRGQQGGELRVGLVVAEDAGRVPAGDDLQAEAVGAQAQALVAVLAEQQRLAVGEVDLGVGLVGLGGDPANTPSL